MEKLLIPVLATFENVGKFPEMGGKNIVAFLTLILDIIRNWR